MSYSTGNESNSLSLAMFASVGLHAVLFISMAFFPASSETTKKPLRIVNLLPPDQLPTTSSGAQAKTSTLEDILKNPLPDLSAGFPPLGNTNEPPPAASEENSSSYVGNGTNLNSRVNTNLNWTNPPNQSFTTDPSNSNSSATSTEQQPKGSPPSSMTPAPNPSNTVPNPSPQQDLPEIPDVAGAFPTPFGAGTPQPFPGSPSALDSGNISLGRGTTDLQAANQIPSSIRTKPRNLSEAVPYAYPVEACRDQLKGTVTLAYFRGPDGSFTDGSATFENQSEHKVLNEAAIDAARRFTPVGTGDYQSHTARFDFVPTDTICAAQNSPGAGQSLPVPSASPTAPEATDKSITDPNPTSDDKSNPENLEKTPSQTDKNQTDKNSLDVPPAPPQAPDATPKPNSSGDRPASSSSDPSEPEKQTTPAESKPPQSQSPESPSASDQAPLADPPAAAPVTPPTAAPSRPGVPDDNGSAADLVPTAPPSSPPVPPPLPATPTLPEVPISPPAEQPSVEAPPAPTTSPQAE